MRKHYPMVGHGMLFGHVQIRTIILNYLIVKEGAGVLHLAGHIVGSLQVLKDSIVSIVSCVSCVRSGKS